MKSYTALKQLIKDKIYDINKIINSMTPLQKYILFCSDNISGINIISNCKIAESNINKVLKNINIPKYILFKIIHLQEEQNSVLNNNKNKDKHIL